METKQVLQRLFSPPEHYPSGRSQGKVPRRGVKVKTSVVLYNIILEQDWCFPGEVIFTNLESACYEKSGIKESEKRKNSLKSQLKYQQEFTIQDHPVLK